MIQFSSDREQKSPEKWQYRLDNFVAENQNLLAALAWGLKQEWGEEKNTLGIDIKPNPHFVACSQEDIEKLNKNTKGHIQEILGIINGYKPDIEVSIIAIGDSQIKLIHFQPETTPPQCFQEAQQDIDTLIAILEKKLSQINFE